MEAHRIKSQLIAHLLNTNDFSASLTDTTQTLQRLKLIPQYTIILVGGTNGKGSTCAYLTHILTYAGYRVGCYTSPHVFDYNERISLNNQAIDDNTLIEALEQVIANSQVNLGLFKSFTLAAHLVFAAKNIDIAVIEVGLGGGKDVTNLFDPDISAITTIALDHCHILGDTLNAIAREKAQIFRSGCPAIIGDPQIPLVAVEYAQQIGAHSWLSGCDFKYHHKELSWDFLSTDINWFNLPFPSLRGTEQLQNAALALAVLAKLRPRFPVNLSQIKTGLLQTNLIGRFQVLPGTPQIILDTAHNPQAVETMLQNMLKLPFANQNIAVFGIALDKDWQTCLHLALKHFDEWHLAAIHSERSCDPTSLHSYLVNNGVKDRAIKIYPTVQEAVLACYKTLTPRDRMLCFGSFLVVEAAYLAIKNVRN